jgi:hypothetical protein
MAKNVTPRPMPTTGMPDRVDQTYMPNDYTDMKKGVQSGGLSINPGKPASSK